jgi:hypothetical protein
MAGRMPRAASSHDPMGPDSILKEQILRILIQP